MSETGAVEANSSTTDGPAGAPAGAAATVTSGATSAAGDGFKAITTQAEFDAVLKPRLDRERAKFSDYDDIKAKADKFDQVTAAQKSELQLAIERAEASERESTELKADKQRAQWREDVAKETKGKIPANVLRGNTLEEIQEHAASLVALLPQPPKPGTVPGEGKVVTAGQGDAATQFAQILSQAITGG